MSIRVVGILTVRIDGHFPNCVTINVLVRVLYRAYLIFLLGTIITQSHNTYVRILSYFFAIATFKKMYNEIKLGGCVDINLTDSLKNLNPSLELLPCQASKSKRRAVSFVAPSENEIYEVPHIDEYSSALIESIWYNDADYQRIQNSCIKIIRKMNSDEPMEKMKKKYCSRGLENFLDARILARRTNRAKAREAVLDEQRKQWMNGIFDPARISNIYAQHSLGGKIEAIYTARRDELESTRVMRYEKKIDASTIENMHHATPLHITSTRNTNAPPQA
jgi:hypothetical protein